MKRKILFSITSLLLLSTAFLMSPRPSYALSVWQIITKKDQSIESFMLAISTATVSGINSTLTGCTIDEMTAEGGCQSTDPLEGYLPGGAFGYMAIAFDEIQNGDNVIPVNLAYYSQDLASSLPLGIVDAPKAYAYNPVESGSAEFSSKMGGLFQKVVLTVWKLTRNIAYSIIVVILVTVGFMIMFRKKINPQLTVSVTNALPRVVLGLILITFSYPIAALTIPFMRAFQEMVSSTFEPIILGRVNATGLLEAIVKSINSSALSTNAGTNLFLPILIVAVVIAFFFAVFSVLFTIVQRFVKIVVATVFGPLILAMGIIPGQENLTSDWIKGLIINTISVPAILIIFYIGLMFIVPEENNVASGSLVADFLKWVVGLGIMFQARKAPGAIANALKAPEMWVPSVGTAKKK